MSLFPYNFPFTFSPNLFPQTFIYAFLLPYANEGAVFRPQTCSGPAEGREMGTATEERATPPPSWLKCVVSFRRNWERGQADKEMSPGHIQTDRRRLPEESLQPVRVPEKSQILFVNFYLEIRVKTSCRTSLRILMFLSFLHYQMLSVHPQELLTANSAHV